MKYFKLENALDDEVIGPNFDQIGYIKPSPILFNSWEFPNLDSSMKIELEDNALVTDFLKSASMSATGYFIEEKVKNIFDKYNLINHKYYEVHLENTQNLKYFWMHIFDLSILDKIDYNKSTFQRTEYGFVEDEIKIDSYQHYRALKDKNGVFFDVDIEDIVLNTSPPYDLLTLLPFETSVYISENLLEELRQAKITGFTVEESKDIEMI